ncbi:MAG: NAD(P)H-dependent glycerol-3-phosphate dehydrogenase [Nitrospirota bacterium]
MSEKIAVIGGGAWGTTLAALLSDKGHEVSLWVYEKDLAERMWTSRINDLYLPGHILPEMEITSDLTAAVKDKTIILTVTPSHVARGVLKTLSEYVPPEAYFVCASKGIENESLMTMSEVVEDVLPKEFHHRTAFLSGPSFAKEVIKKMPTAVSAASREPATARHIQSVFSTEYFRVYTSPDVMGVELGGALKNVIAIAAGCSDGLGFGHNTRAALITRGLAEIARLGMAMGANPLTFSGLSGMGDLVLTCTGELSRNRTVGYRLGKGEQLSDILSAMKMVAEGVKTTKAAYGLSKKYGVPMPITEQVYNLLYEGKEASKVVKDLMTRDLKSELG